MDIPPSRNLELKVEVGPDGLADVRTRLDDEHHPVVMRMRQRDRYIIVPRGRLKLREIRTVLPTGDTHTAELIAYERPTASGSRWSSYQVVPVDPDHADRLISALAITHDQGATVDKQRDVVLWGNTRIHLDEVTGLGSFVELETVSADGREDLDAAAHARIVAALGLDRWPAIAGSYSDLLASRPDHGPA